MKTDDFINSLKTIGTFNSSYNALTGQSITTKDIKVSEEGLRKHLNDHDHPECLPYIDQLSEIINKADYIGKHPDIENSIEYIKEFTDITILVAVKLDEENKHLYVSTMYGLSKKRLKEFLDNATVKKVA